MNIIYQSVKFDPANITSRYFFKYSMGEVKFFDVNAKHKTIREYWLYEKDCDETVKLAPYSEMVKL